MLPFFLKYCYVVRNSVVRYHWWQSGEECANSALFLFLSLFVVWIMPLCCSTLSIPTTDDFRGIRLRIGERVPLAMSTIKVRSQWLASGNASGGHTHAKKSAGKWGWNLRLARAVTRQFGEWVR